MSEFLDLEEFESVSSSEESYNGEESLLKEDRNPSDPVQDFSEMLSASLVSNVLSNANSDGQRIRNPSVPCLEKYLYQILPPNFLKLTGKPKPSQIQSALARSDIHKSPKQVLEEEEHQKNKNLEKSKQAGAGWFNMKSTQVTEEIKHDLKLLKMRNYLDSKRFYKRENTKDAIPKVFQIGTVVSGAQEYYSSRLTKKEQSKSFVDELLRDQQTKQLLKRKASEIRTRTQRPSRSGANKKRKRPKTKSMFDLPSV